MSGRNPPLYCTLVFSRHAGDTKQNKEKDAMSLDCSSVCNIGYRICSKSTTSKYFILIVMGGERYILTSSCHGEIKIDL